MRSSTVKREKLVKPQHIAFIVVLFVVAFFVLVPSRQTFQYASSPEAKSSAKTVDALDLAYLKATHSTGVKTGADVASAVQTLVKEGRVDEARDLVSVYPEVSLSEADRFLLDLELAAADWSVASASGEDLTVEKQAQFINLLTLVQHRMQLQQFNVLERVLALTLPLDDSALSDDMKTALLFDVYQLLSQRDSENALVWMRTCGDTLANLNAHTLSVECFRSALEMQPGDDRFDLEIALLRQLYKTGNRNEIDRLESALLADSTLDKRKLETLAGVLLEQEKPSLAYRVYERLSVIDEPGKVQWLEEAARWAEASDDLLQAVTYLEQARENSDWVRASVTEKRIQSLLIASGETSQALSRLEASVNSDLLNTETLRQAIPTARLLGNDELAQRWNERLLEQEPYNFEAMNQQIELALGRADLATALRWSTVVLESKPFDSRLRRRHARIAEWAGDPMQATHHWQWLAENGGNMDAIDEVVRLSELTLQPHIAATALRRLVQRVRPTSGQVSRLVAFYELEGRPDLAAETLRELTSRYGANRHVMTELAKLHYRNKHYQQALLAWQQVRNYIGKSSEETLSRIELHWRLNQPERAISVARELPGTSLISDATDYQISVISELAWRYREHKLALLVKPMLATVENRRIKVLESQRLIDAWLGMGDKKSAQAEALERWRETGLSEFGLTTLQIAFDRGDDAVVAQFITDTQVNRKLFDLPEYWNLRAAAELQQNNIAQAINSYGRALQIDTSNVDAVAGLLWMHIGENDIGSPDGLLEKYRNLATHSNQLWTPYALLHLQAGDVVESLVWFDRLQGAMTSDYGLLLVYADALELAGQSEDATAIRSYTFETLRPLLTDGSHEDHDLLLQQYSRMVTRYTTSDEQYAWAQAVLNEKTRKHRDNRFWREDMAITWLMSTQLHDYARLIMAEFHRNRLKQPDWQTLALAMQEQDIDAVTALLQQGTKISKGDQILAMRQVGWESEAHALSVKTLENPPSVFDRQIAQQQYGSLRLSRPSHSTGRYRSLSVNRLGIDETGLSLRHSLFNRDVGYGVDLTKRRFNSSRFLLAGNREESDIALSLYMGDRNQGGQLTAGYLSTEDNDLMYAAGRYHRRNLKGTTELRAEVTYNEKITGSPELRLAAVQNRASVTLDVAVGAREYILLGADVNDITTKVEQNRVARGMQARAEFGLRGANGNHSWSTSIQARSTVNDRADTLPDELFLSNTTTMDSVLAEKSSMLGVGFTVARGGVGEDYPQVSSPRYFLNASIAQTWPTKDLGVQLNAGAGIRVLGGDELGFTLSHDTQPQLSSDIDSDTTSFGLNYRYHF